MQGTDEILAQRARDGSREAFEALVVAHQSRVYGLALHLLRNPEDAADAVQEAWVRCYAALGRYDPEQSFGAWLYRIVYNHCLDILRRHKRSPIVPVGKGEDELSALDTAADPGLPIQDLVERAEAARGLREVLNRLSEEHRQVLALRYMLDLSYAEIAHLLGVPDSTVTMRLHHAKRAMRRELQRTGEDKR